MEQKLLESVYEFVDEIKSSDSYKRLLILKQTMEEDQELHLLLTAFQKVKVNYDEVSKYGKYHPDLKRVRKELSDVKQQVFTHPVIVEYKVLEKEIQSILNNASKEIADAVSGKIKHPNELGLIPKHEGNGHA